MFLFADIMPSNSSDANFPSCWNSPYFLYQIWQLLFRDAVFSRVYLTKYNENNKYREMKLI